MERVPVGVSACLNGMPVRHDGAHRRSDILSGRLNEFVELVPFCPEAGAGLGTPRPAMRLVQTGSGTRLRTVRDGQDHTDALRTWSRSTLPRFERLAGFILMGRSPSCGMERVRLYREDGRPRRDGQGIFAATLLNALPLLPVEEEGRLHDDVLRENFFERVFVYEQWHRLNEAGLSPAALIDFHSRHKFQLLAHSPVAYAELGRLLANLSTDPLERIAATYIEQFMTAMRTRISRGAHVNVMLHMLGFYRGRLGDCERSDIRESIDAYLTGEVPLVVPMTLLRLAGRRAPDKYLDRQRYLAPYPDALGLRNRI